MRVFVFFSFCVLFSLLSYYVSLRSELRIVMSATISAYTQCSIRLYLQLFVWGIMSYLRYLCLRKVVCDTYCIVFLFSLSSSCVPNVASFSGLSISDYTSVFSNVYLSCVPNVATVSLDCPFLIALLCSLTFIYLVYQMLPVSLDCPFLITLRYSLTFIYSFSGLSISDYPSVFSNVYHVASFSRLSISDYPSVFSNVYLQFLWIVHFWLPFGIL
jgi:hypothetical protein